MIAVTYFPTIATTTPAGIENIGILFETIRVGGKDGNLKRNVEEIRRYPHNKDIRTSLKRNNLPVITWQGVFNPRENKGVQSLSGLMCIDIDHCSDKELELYKPPLISEPWCVAVFLSPSGDGLKVIVQTDNYDIAAYHNCYCQLEEYFLVNYGVKPDKNCEPISQGCFASYDPEIYVNLNTIPFHLEYNPLYDKNRLGASASGASASGVYQTMPPTFMQRFQNALSTAINGMSDEKIIEILDRRFSRYPQNYQDGNRTRSVFAQAVILCQAGIPQVKAADYLMSRFLPTDFLKEKVLRETANAYSKNGTFFGIERGQYLNYPNYRKSKYSNM